MKKTLSRRIAVSLLMCILSLGLLCSCADSSQKPEEPDPYEYLKTGIVGMWMEEGGPYMADSFVYGPGYDFYEFTSDNVMYFHHLYKNEQGGIVDGVTSPGNYHFEKNAMIYDEVEQPTPEQFKTSSEEDAQESGAVEETAGTEETSTTPEGQKAGVYVEIDGNLMTMESANGVTRYVRLSLEETTAYLLHYQDEEYKTKQEEYMKKLEEEEIEKERAESAASESAAEETAEETVSESSAAETEAVTAEETAAGSAEETAAEPAA